MTYSPSLRVALALLGWVVLPGGEGQPTTVVEPQGPEVVTLYETTGEVGLKNAYGLPVTEVAAPPSFALAQADAEEPPAASPQKSCPVELHAVVVADEASDSFAVARAGSDSLVLHAGDGFHARGSLMSVASISPTGIVVRWGDTRVVCGLAPQEGQPKEGK